MRSNLFLELAGVSLRINNRLVFRNTHWSFARDQNWALVGSNGSGKTLLARSIAGELPVACPPLSSCISAGVISRRSSHK